MVPGLKIQVKSADGDKCDRCWIHDPSVESGEAHPALCRRCAGVLEALSASER
ncbi:MAG: zinc finger domain-containing protein [Deltaproteobacteria bacterium]